MTGLATIGGSSFFTRVTRYRVGAAMDPSENRLTESTAALLEAIPGLGRALTGWLIGRDPGSDPSIRTQRLSASGGFIDFELRFGPITRPDLLVWVEVKHWSVPTLGQLERYLSDIRSERAADHRLVLLIPDGVDAPEGIDPTQVDVVRWQAVHRDLRRWLHRWKRDLQPEGAWLISQFLRFMEEEGVADPGALSSIDVVAAVGAPRAFSLLQRLREGADALIGTVWEQAHLGGGSHGQFYRHNRPIGVSNEEWVARWPIGWFEWRLTTDVNLPDPTGGLVFGAGYTRNKRSLPSGEPAMAWIAHKEAQGFEVFVDDQWRLYRHLRLDAVLAADSLEGQAKIVADFVVSAFDELNRDPCP